MTDLMKSRVRKPLSTLLALAMVFSIVIIPAGAFAAEPATASPTITSGGTNLDSLGATTTATNGFNGTHSIEVTGVVATQSLLKGTTAGNTATLNDLDVTHTDDFVIRFGSTDTTITGLTLSSTVADVMSKITSQITSLTAGRDSISRLTLTAKPYGPLLIAALGDSTGVAAKVFGPLGTVSAPTIGWGWRFDLGVDYGIYGAALPAGFQINDTFIDAVSGSKLLLPAPKVGSLDPITGAFRDGIRSADNLWTAIELSDGYDLDVTTSGGKGIALGTATVVVSGGVRTAVKPTFSVAPVTAQAGATATVAAQVTAAAGGALDGATFTLPEGFVATGTPTATMAGQATTVTVVGGVYTVTGGAGKLVAQPGQTITLVAPVVASTKAGAYKLTGTYKNFGGSATPAMDPAAGITVIAEDKVATVQFVDNPLFARAGQTAVVGAHLLDRFGNVLTQVRSVAYSVTSTLSAGQSGTITTQDPFYGYKASIITAKTEGVTTVKYSASKPGAAVEASGSVTIDTTGVGVPTKLKVVSAENPADAGSSVFFRTQLIDANGKTTAFLANEAEDPTAATLNYGPNAGLFKTAAVSIPARFSEAVTSLTSDPADTVWEMWAFDTVGRVAKSETLTQIWTPAAAAGEFTGLTVTATPALVGKPNYGYAAADGVSSVLFTVKTNVVVAGRKIMAAPAAGMASKPGVLVNTSAVTDASGVATFTVVSNTPNAALDFKQWIFSDSEKPTIQGTGFTYFFAPEVRAVTVDKTVAFADGKDAVTFSFTVKNPLDKTVVQGTRIYFKPVIATTMGLNGWNSMVDTASVLSTTSAVTDANGVASVSVTRATTSGGKLVGVEAMDFAGVDGLNSLNPDPTVNTDAAVGAYFTDYMAVVKDGAALTAQQSERGPELTFDFVLKDAAGNTVSFDHISGFGSPSTTVSDESVTETASVATASIHLSDDPQAGATVKFVLNGTAVVEGPFSSFANQAFFGEFSVGIVNKATATGRGSVVLERANISGSGFKPGIDLEVWATKVAGGKKYFLGFVDANEDGIVRQQAVNLFNFPVGKYDLYVDGIKFPGALEVIAGFDIGLGKTLIRNWSSPLKAKAGKKAIIYGQISPLTMDGQAHGGLARPVYLRYRAKSTSSWSTLAVRVSNDAGGYSFTMLKAKKGEYCVWSPGDGTWLANSSVAYGAKPIVIK